jgi:hypothetical protein
MQPVPSIAVTFRHVRTLKNGVAHAVCKDHGRPFEISVGGHRDSSKVARFDFLAEAEQMTLPKAFAEIRHGLEQLEVEGTTESIELRALLASAEAAYDRADNISGAHLLQDFEELAFPGNLG